MNFPGAGELRWLVTIQKLGDIDPATGLPPAEWVTEFENVPCKIEELGGTDIGPDKFWMQQVGSTQLIPTESHRITMRYLPGLDGTRRLLLPNDAASPITNIVLDILSVSDIEHRHVYMLLRCRERVGVTE